MFKYLFHLTAFILFFTSIYSAEFTISSYNCGGLSEHYDYLRAACMQKLVQDRYNQEPEIMALSEKIQRVALAMLYSHHPEDKKAAQQLWKQKNYAEKFKQLTADPKKPNSPNALWHQKNEAMLTSYKVRPVIISDMEVQQMLTDHLKDQNLDETRAIMAERIFKHHLKYDILCLQEADYLDATMFPDNYAVEFTHSSHSKNAIAWNTNRFEEIEVIGDIHGRAIVLQLLEKETGKTVLVASGHLTGCNPFYEETDPKTLALDSAKGDHELQEIIDFFATHDADFKLIAIDSNVTATHPRLQRLSRHGYLLDTENHLEPTCTNPYQVLNTRIDWIALKSPEKAATITNVPVTGVGLNSIQTNISDHKPIAAKIHY